MSIVLVGSTSGSITLQEPAVSGSTVLTLPATTGNVVVDGATQTLTNKTLTSPTLTTPNIDSAQFATVSGTAPIYPCRAWVNFNGTGTVAIRASGNVSSITDNGTGLYTANFTTSMPDANYTSVVGANINSSNDDVRRNCRITNWSTSSTSIVTGNNSNSDSKEDFEFVTVAVFR